MQFECKWRGPLLGIAAQVVLVACSVACGACSTDDPGADPDQAAAGAAAGGSGGAGPVMTGGSAGGGASGGAAAVPSGGVGSAAEAGTTGSASVAGASGAEGSTIGGAGGGASASGNGAGGAGSSGEPGATACSRELLKSTVDAYFVALAAHDASSLPLAADVKLTENGEVMQLGEGLWQSAGMASYTQSALDTESCSTASQAVVPDGSMDIPLALRLQLVAQSITEIEMIAVRPGDYQVFGSEFASKPSAIIAADADVGWETPVPEDQRNTREEIGGWIDKYFRVFPRGVCDVASTCKRLENGGGSFDCSYGASCDAGPPGAGDAVMEPRLILVDVETGIGVGFTLFMGNTDLHMYKMHGGEVHAVHAILGAADSSGWD